MPIQISDEQKAEIGRAYFETTESLDSIGRRFEISRYMLCRFIRAWGWPLRGGPGMASHRRALMRWREEEAAAEADAGAAPFDAAAGDGPLDRVALAARLRTTVEAELAAAERALRPLPGRPRRPAEMERAARTLAILVKTLAELRRYDDAAAGVAEQEESAYGDPGALRAELSRRLAALRAQAEEARGAAAAPPRPA